MVRNDADSYYSQPRGMLMLWAALLLGPIAWILHQAVSYLLVYWACGTGYMFVFHLAGLATLLMAGAGAWLGWKAWTDTGKGWVDDGGARSDRSRFMAVGGLISSGLFALVILAQWIPAFIVNPCVR